MTPQDVQRILNAHGFPCGAVDGDIGPRTRQAVARFQFAWHGLDGLGWLAVDRVPGPATQACLERLPHLSAHFTVWELRSKGDHTCYVRRELVDGLERYREIVGPFRPMSAYRDPAHNRRVGGAQFSMHVEGLGADVPLAATVVDVRALGMFSGIGRKGELVRHVDMRHLSSQNRTPHASPANPAQWRY